MSARTGSRNKQVHCFVSPDEKDELAILAEVRGLSVSAYLRSLYLQDRARYYGGDANHLNLVPPSAIVDLQNRSLAS